MDILHNYSLRAHNTFGIDARCKHFVECSTVDQAQQAAQLLGSERQQLLIIGGGSNLLLTCDYPGMVLRSAIQGMQAVDDADDVLVRAGSGMTWDTLVARCVSNGWHGMENLSFIPGDVGASAVQNIGAYGAEAADIIYKVEAVRLSDAKVVEIDADDCGYGYRDSRFKHEWMNSYLITHVTYRLSRHFRPLLDYGNIRVELQQRNIEVPTAQQLRDVIIGIRRNKLPDPAIEGNAGSFFMNPVISRQQYEQLRAQYADMPHYDIDQDHVKVPAAWLIDQCGWKGRTIGRAGVHSRQALVLVNKGGATGQDIVDLCQSIRDDVERRFGIVINPEVNIV